MQKYQQLEQEFAKFTGKKYAVALNSGTSALHLGLLALGIKKGDEVIIPDFTFVACAFAVSYIGAKPVFVDCKDDYTIDENLIERKITKKTKAIMPVHVYSNKCAMDKIMKIAKKYKLKVIEDCSEHHAVKLSKSDVACYSLQSSKQIHCQEGGILVTDSKTIYDEVNKLKGFYNNGYYFHQKLSFNYRMPNATAELALRSLKAFKGKDWVTTHLCKTEKERDNIIKTTKGTRCFFKPLSTMPMYKKKPGKNAERLSKLGYIKYICKHN